MFKRIITGLILLLVAFSLLFLLPYRGFFLATIIIFIYAGWEWANLIPTKSIIKRLLYMFLLLCLMFTVTQLSVFDAQWLLVISTLWWLFALVSLFIYNHRQKWLSSSIVHAIAGIFVLIPCWLALNVIRVAQNGVKSLVFLLLIICATDIGAYFTGKCFGKHKLMPKVSPNKTWEGFYGGILLAVLMVIIGAIVLNIEPGRWPLVVILGLLTSVAAVIGDLFESLLKRQVGLKDSGNIFPGHGGLLDRIDSLVAAAPIFLLSCLWLNTHF